MGIEYGVKVGLQMRLIAKTAYLIVIWPLLTLMISGCQDSDVPPSNTISDTDAASPIILAAASGASGYHVLSSSEDRGARYRSFDPQTISWTKPMPLSDKAASSLAIASEGDLVHIFWSDGTLHYYRSENGGHTWDDGTRAFASVQGSIDYLSALAVQGVVHVLFGNRTDLYYRRGDEAGKEWGVTRTLASSQSGMLSEASLAVNPGDGLHVVWADYFGSSGSSEGVLSCRTSSDGGATWRDAEDLFTAVGSLITQPAVAAAGERVIIAWISDGILHCLTLEGGQRISLQTIEDAWPAGGAGRTLDLVSCGQDAACLVWIDRRHAHKEWWAGLPLHEIVTWDKDPYWANNDVYLKRLVQGNHGSRLTRDLSYAFSLDASARNDKLVILWSGMTKVGRAISSSVYPYQIFWLEERIEP